MAGSLYSREQKTTRIMEQILRSKAAPHGPLPIPALNGRTDMRAVAAPIATVLAAAPPAAPAGTGQAASPLETHAERAAELMRQLGNDRRILLLCFLIQEGEVTVTRLAQHVGLSMSAVSQHLKVLRWDGLVAARRQGAEIHYRVADPRVARLISVLEELFGEDADA